METAFGYATVGQMLGHFPRRYMEIGELSKISELPVGEDVTIVAEVKSVNQRRMHSRSGFLLEVVVSDALGPEQSTLRMTFFNGYEAKRDLQVGCTAMFSGKVTIYRNHLELTHPEYSLLDTAEEADPRPIPIYPATAKFPNKKIREVMDLLLAKIAPGSFEDFIPEDILDIPEAFRAAAWPSKISIGRRQWARDTRQEGVLPLKRHSCFSLPWRNDVSTGCSSLPSPATGLRRGCSPPLTRPFPTL